jgi:flagellar biosynthesis/type III secretory pathway protein FliH
LYNPTLPGKAANQGAARGTHVWQPLAPLRPIELQKAGFVQQSYAKNQAASFSLWTVEDQKAASQLAESEDGLHADIDDVTAKGEDDGQAGHTQEADALNGLDAQALERLKEEAYQRGVADGQQLAQAEALAQVEKGESASLLAMADKANQLLVNIEQSVVALKESPQLWHEPLKRLALHLAEQLTLAELSISSNSIQTLIARCIETLDVQVSSSVVVELNPNDMALLQNHKAVPGEQAPQWRLVADPHLLPGSVRVRADDAVVSDLIEHRLETLAQALLQNTKPWQAQTAFQPERLAARRGKVETVEDALAKPVQASPLDLSSLDLPDLELPDSNVIDADSSLGALDD